MRSTLSLTARSLFWAVLLPGFFAGFAPWYFFGLNALTFDIRNPLHAIGGTTVVLGVMLLASCIWEFARRGRGTLSPLDPPRMLVVQGLYRYVRNPMYLAVTVIVLGEALLAASGGLLVYWMIWFACANLFVIGYEEPALQRQFGASYDTYRSEVGRWIPRLTPYRVRP
jgi:protein-S-isoprenylcysteine O-methyltransferase Ste14